MMSVPIKAADAEAVDRVAKSCGDLAIGCTDASERITTVTESLTRQLSVLEELEKVTSSLEADQRRAAESTDEARLLAEHARARLEAGAQIIRRALTDFSVLTNMVVHLGEQVTSFAEAMDQVRRVTSDIDGIARTTNMLALNAAIEAERAGPAGRTFAVVAAEVKKLARDTRGATEKIGATIGSLGSKSETLVAEIGESANKSRAAQASFAEVDRTVADVMRIVEQVEDQSDGIARSTSLIHDNALRVRDSLTGFARDSRANGDLLRDAQHRMGDLELLSNQMFNELVHSGFAPEDQAYVAKALAIRDEIQELVDGAIASGRISHAEVFDTRYEPVSGTNPEQYVTRFSAFADEHIRPILDRVAGADRRVEGTVCSDMNGYLPTHESRCSHPQRSDDITWNIKNCRNRRIFFDRMTQRAVKSDAPFMMAVYRLDRGSELLIVKDVFVPLHFQGRRWGNYEIAYANS